MIRYLQNQDIEECTKMFEEFYTTDAVSHKIPIDNIKHAITLALEDSPYIKILICEHEGKYAGFCALSFTFSTEAGGVVVLIEDIYIRNEFTSKGLGTAIFSFIHQQYDDKAKRYRLEVAHNNAHAIRLYKKLGFEELPYKQFISQ